MRYGHRWLVVALFACSACAGEAEHSVEVQRCTLGGRAVSLPGGFDDALEPSETYRLECEVTLPPAMRGRRLSLTVPRHPAPLDAEAAGQALEPLFETAQAYRTRGPHAYRIPEELTDAEALEVALIGRYTWDQAGWMDAAPVLSTNETGASSIAGWWRFEELSHWFALTILLLVTLTYVPIWYARGAPEHGYFALMVFGASFYPMYSLVPGAVGTLDTAIMIGMVATAAVSGVYFSHAKFGPFPPPPVWKAGWALAGLAGLSGAFPFLTQEVTAPLAGLLIGGVSIYQTVFYLRLIRRDGQHHATAYLTAWAGLLVMAGADTLAWLGLGPHLPFVKLGSVGLVYFGVSQFITLSLEHVQLNAALAEQVESLESGRRENERLTTELRRQVAERSRQLSEALARLSGIAAPEPLEPGAVLQDRYRVVRSLGRGAHGTVFEAERLSDGQAVALKLMQASKWGAGLSRLAREAHIAASLDHPNVVPVWDVDLSPHGIFIVMELVEGRSLEEARAQFGNVPWGLPILRDVSAALAAVHRQNVLHRDLKPANVLLEPTHDGVRARLTDFGISSIDGDLPPMTNETLRDDQLSSTPRDRDRQLGSDRQPGSDGQRSDSSSLTQTSAVLGTPWYIAPEVCHGMRYATPAADVFSFGMLAYEVLTAERPFPEPPLLLLEKAKTIPTPVPIASRRPIPRELARLFDRCLASVVGERPTAEEIHRALHRWLAEREVRATP